MERWELEALTRRAYVAACELCHIQSQTNAHTHTHVQQTDTMLNNINSTNDEIIYRLNEAKTKAE